MTSKERLKLHELCKDYNMKTSVAKTKTMAFKGKELIRLKLSWIRKQQNKSKTLNT